MPAHALNPRRGWKVLDCCAAPGNKTTHVAALVGQEGAVIACEKDPLRFETLKATLARCKASNVQPMLEVRISPIHLTFNSRDDIHMLVCSMEKCPLSCCGSADVTALVDTQPGVDRLSCSCKYTLTLQNAAEVVIP
jgi:hypothetical protein